MHTENISGMRHDQRLAEAFLAIRTRLLAMGCLLSLLLCLHPMSVWATQPAWTTGFNLPNSVELAKAVRHTNVIYVVGGRNADGSGSSGVFYSIISQNGVPGTWGITSSLPNPLYFHAVAVANKHIFVIGGWDGSNWRREVWKAPIQADGSLGGWQNAGLYPTEIALHEAIGVGNRIYVLGGQNNASGPLNIVQFIEVGADGNLMGDWMQTTSLPAPRYRFSVTALSGYLYATGGYDGTNAQDTVYYTRIDSNGHIPVWNTTFEKLPVSQYYHSSYTINGSLVVVGGNNGSISLSSVCSAPLASGVPTSWNCNEVALPNGLERFAAVSYSIVGRDGILVTGGRSGDAIKDDTYIFTEPLMDLTLYNAPDGFMAPSEEVTYTVRYQNRPFFDLSDVSVVATIPDGVKLVPDSQGTGSVSGNQITWQVGNLGKSQADVRSYRVRREHPADTIEAKESITNVLGITKTGPLIATVDESFDYHLAITTTVHMNYRLEVVDTLPAGVEFISATTSRNGTPSLMANNVISISFASPDFRPGETITLTVRVKANQPGVLVNKNYAVLGGHDPAPQDVQRTSGDVIDYLAYGLREIETVALPPGGDGTVILHQPVQATWKYGTISGSAASNRVANPDGNLNLRLPIIRR